MKKIMKKANNGVVQDKKNKDTKETKAVNPGIRMKPSSALTTSKIPKEATLKKSELMDFSYKPQPRVYSDSEKKMMSVLEKGKKADGTMKEGAQRKIASIRAKERAVAKRAENKAGRVAKRAAIGEAKANVKAVRKSFKK